MKRYLNPESIDLQFSTLSSSSQIPSASFPVHSSHWTLTCISFLDLAFLISSLVDIFLE